MKIHFQTDLYDFLVFLGEIEGEYNFEILAICKTDNTRSFITNLNFIISDLLLPTVNIEDYETTITVSQDAGIKLGIKAIRLFNDKAWIKYLVKALADDKLAGEWETYNS